MGIVAALLDRLAVLRNCLAERETLAQSYIPLNLLNEISDLKRQGEVLEGEIKRRASHSVKHTLVGTSLQLVWQERLDISKLTELARKLGATEAQIEGCRGNGYWSIRKRGK